MSSAHGTVDGESDRSEEVFSIEDEEEARIRRSSLGEPAINQE